MTYDVPLPPCVEHERQRVRWLHEADNAASDRAGLPRRAHLDASVARTRIVWGIWRHCDEQNIVGVCGACQRLLPWDVDPNTVDPGTYADLAGHHAVAMGYADPDFVLTARQTAAQTSRAFLKKRSHDG